MDLLDSNTLLEAMYFCDSHSRARVGIALKNSFVVHTFMDSFCREILGNDNFNDWWTIPCPSNCKDAFLKNVNSGSLIHIFDSEDPLMYEDKHYDRILFTDDISMDILHKLSTVEGNKQKEKEFENSMELEEFLSSFKVI